LKKKHVGKHCSKTKTMWGNILTIHNIFFKKNYETKSTKTVLKKNHLKKKKSHVGNIVVIHNILKKKTIKLNFQTVQY
jgi:hypothetical protein